MLLLLLCPIMCLVENASSSSVVRKSSVVIALNLIAVSESLVDDAVVELIHGIYVIVSLSTVVVHVDDDDSSSSSDYSS